MKITIEVNEKSLARFSEAIESKGLDIDVVISQFIFEYNLKEMISKAKREVEWVEFVNELKANNNL